MGYKCKRGHGFCIAQSCSHRALSQAHYAKSRLTLYVMPTRWSTEFCSESNPPLFNKTPTNLEQWNISDLYSDGIEHCQVNLMHPKCFDRFQGY